MIPTLKTKQNQISAKNLKFEEDLFRYISTQSDEHTSLGIRRFHTALLQFLSKEDQSINPGTSYRKQIVQAFTSRQVPITPDHAENLTYRVAQRMWVEHYPKIIPVINGYRVLLKDGHTFQETVGVIAEFDERAWYKLIEILFSPKYFEKYLHLLNERSTQTNKETRYINVAALAIKYFGYQNRRGLKWLDVGSSLGLGTIRVANKTKIFESPKKDPTRIFYDLRLNEIPFNKFAIQDITEPDPYWVWVCKHYPEELKNAEAPEDLVKATEELEEFKVETIVGSILDNQFRGENADMISALTTIYQIPRGLQNEAVVKLLERVRPGGILLIVDFLEANEQGTQIIPVKKWFGTDAKGNKLHNYKVTVALKDSSGNVVKNGREGFLFDIGGWSDGRCRDEFKPGRDFDTVFGSNKINHN